jgi:ribosomal-protein-alanine N-acetyltransferase
MSGSDTGDIVLLPLMRYDLIVAASLHEACFEEAWDASAIAKLLSLPGSLGLLALVSGQPVGLVIARGVEDEAEILTIGVLPAFRRRGVGSRLLERIGERLAEAGRSRLVLEVAEDNAAALALYDRASFAQVGRRLGYYKRVAGGTAAAIVLARTLHSQPD